MYVCMYLITYVHMFVYIRMYVYVYICMYTYIYVNTGRLSKQYKRLCIPAI